MSSGLRASPELDSSAVETWQESDKGDYEENDELLHDAEEGDVDVFEDAATLQQQGQEGRSDFEQDNGAPLGMSPIRVRAPVSDDAEEEPDNEEEGDDDEDDDGGEGAGSFGSGESFDSALERMAASSTAASSPKITSPRAVNALMRLNEMLSGQASLDTSVIENSSEEEFKERIAELAKSLGLSLEDPSFSSIEDALLPLVVESSERKRSAAEPENPVGIDFSQSTDGEPIAAQSPMPRAKITANDEVDEGENDDSREHGAVENGEEGDSENDYKELSKGQVEQEPLGEVLVSSDLKQAPKTIVNSLSVNSNGEGESLEDTTEAEELQPEVGAGDSASQNVNGDEVDPGDATSLDGSGDEVVSEDAEQAVNPETSPAAESTTVDNDDNEEREEVGDQNSGNSEVPEIVSEEHPEEEATKIPVPEVLSQQTSEHMPVDTDALGAREVTDKDLTDEAPEVEEESMSPAESNMATEYSGAGHVTVEDVDSGAPGAGEVTDENLNEPADEASKADQSSTLSSESSATEAPGAGEGIHNLDAKGPEASGAGEVEDEDLSTSIDDTTEAEETSKIPSETTVATEAPVADEVTDRDFSKLGDESTKAEEASRIPSEGERVQVNFDDMEEDEAGNSEEEFDDEDEDDGDAFTEKQPAFAVAVDTPPLGAAGPSLPARPTRTVLRSSAPSLEPSPRIVQQSRAASAQLSSPADDSHTNGDAIDGNEETREKLQAIRVKFLRLALRLGQSAHNVVVAQVLYRLGLAEQLRGGRSSSRTAAFSFDRASAIAEEQEAAGPEELDFTCTIMLLGKTGVGKSATINSIFDEPKTGTNAFSPSTNKVQVITGLVHGIKVRVIDTPGLLPSFADQRRNEKVMASVKGFIKKQSPDIVLYFDRLDMQSRDYGDLPLLRTITDTFGAAVWFNAIVVLTHASSAPPDGPNGLPLSYEMFVAQRSHVVQQTIRQAAGDMRLMNPVSLVENHPACRVNRAKERVLPNGQVWKPQLLLLCFASKILAEANSLLKLQDSTPGRPFAARPRVPPLPFLLSSLLQSRAQLKLPDEQVGDEDESDEELEEEDSDDDEDYDQLPPFRRLAKEEVAELDEDNRSKYFEELAERERLFQKKLWKEELKRRRELKKRMAESIREENQLGDEILEEEMSRAGGDPVPMPDMQLPPSFDSDNPSHRYRYLEPSNQWLVRPVMETHGWDHDCGYDGMSLEKMFVIGDNIPASISGQVTKDKKEASVNMECAASLKHGEGKVTLAGLDLQTVGKDLAYTLRSETRFSNFKGNKTTGGLAVTLLGDTVSAGMKIEDRLFVGKRLKLVLNGGAITGRGDVAYGGSLEATLRDKLYPLSRTLSTLGLSIMDWHGDLAIGGNLQSQFMLGKTMMVGRANLNNRGAGQITIRASSSDQLQMTLIGLIPIVRSIVNRLLGSQSQQ